MSQGSISRWRTRMPGPRRKRVIGSVPQNFGGSVTAPGTLGVHGLQVVMTVKGATDAEAGRTSVKRLWGPALGPGEIVVMDNLRVQVVGWEQQTLTRRRRLRCLRHPSRRTCRRASLAG
jgi:hypothetical protein